MCRHRACLPRLRPRTSTHPPQFDSALHQGWFRLTIQRMPCCPLPKYQSFRRTLDFRIVHGWLHHLGRRHQHRQDARHASYFGSRERQRCRRTGRGSRELRRQWSGCCHLPLAGRRSRQCLHRCQRCCGMCREWRCFGGPFPPPCLVLACFRRLGQSRLYQWRFAGRLSVAGKCLVFGWLSRLVESWMSLLWWMSWWWWLWL